MRGRGVAPVGVEVAGRDRVTAEHESVRAPGRRRAVFLLGGRGVLGDDARDRVTELSGEDGPLLGDPSLRARRARRARRVGRPQAAERVADIIVDLARTAGRAVPA